MRFFTLIAPAGLVVFSTAVFAAEATIVESRLGALQRLTAPERLTFGPEDHFQGSRSPDGRYLLFTRKLNLTPEVLRLDVQSRATEELGSEFANAEQPQFSPDGKKFLFLRPSARSGGEICWRDTNGGKVSCFTNPEGEKQFPFWLANDRIGYVAKGLRAEIRAFTPGAAASEILLAGSFLHPAAAPNGDLALIERMEGGRTRLVLRRGGKTCDAPMAWAGGIAFPSFASDGATVVFSAYLVDSNRDGKIDVNDRSIVATVPAEALCGTAAFVPRVLTSLEKDCGHARLSGKLDITCAFEGSLDLYQMPASGQLPEAWGAKEWLSAHASARGPEERLFVLLSLASRAPATFGDLSTRIWIQYLLMDDDVGAAAWFPKAADELKLSAEKRDLWKASFQAGTLRKSEPPGELSLLVKQRLREIAGRVSAKPASVLRAATLARISDFVGDTKSARASLGTALKAKTSILAELLLVSGLWERSGETDEGRYLEFLAANVDPKNTAALPLFVKSLERLEASLARRATVARFAERLPASPARTLFELELLNLDVVEGRKDAYLAFDKRFVPLKAEPALLRAVAYRAIRSWTKADKSENVQFVASNLMTYLEAPGFEFTGAYDYYISSAFDRGYEMEAAKQWGSAVAHFYGAVTLTDDLEAHWGYLRNMVAAGRASALKAQLDNLVARNFTKALEPRVRKMAELAQKDARALDEGELESFLDAFGPLPGEAHPIARFLQGSLRLQKLLVRPWKGDDKQLADTRAIYRDLTLALDGARDNERLKLAVLDNLAVLQSHSRQWGEAAKAWAARGRHGFETPGAKAIAGWYEAQAQFHLGDFARATELLQGARAEDVPADWRVPFFHRQSLYAALAQENALSLAAASRGLAAGAAGRGAWTLRMLRGRAELMLGKKTDAAKTLAALWSELEGATEDQPPDGRPWGGSLRRLKILASGFLIQASEDPRWLEARERALDMSVATAKNHGFTGDSFYELRLKTALGLLAAGEGTLETRLPRLLEDLDGYASEAGLVASNAWFEALNGAMVLDLEAKAALTPDRRAELAGKTDVFIASAEKVPYPSPLLWSQTLRLKATRLGFLRSAQKDAGIDELLASKEMKSLREQSPALATKTELWLKAAR